MARRAAVDKDQEEKLMRLVDALDAVNERREREGREGDVYKDLGFLLDHSGSVNEVMNTVRSFTLVGRVLRKSLVWLVSTVGVIIAFTTFLKGGLGWLVHWVTIK